MKSLLYYKYSNILDPVKFRNEQYNLCKKLGLKGRILIAEEGINGTVCGEDQTCDEYKHYVSSLNGFEDIEWKEDEVSEQIFPKLKVLVREEIVTLGLKNKSEDVKIENKADYIEPEELLQMYENSEDFVIVDARNAYEGRIGKFKNAIVPNIKAFKELPEYIKNDEKFQKIKHKQIITYCTGGIRCEKFSALLKKSGFTNVKQLHGGIHNYSKKVGGKYFDGQMYVFDSRVNVEVNKINPVDIAECKYCGTKVSRFVNCRNTQCNEQFICCVECDETYSSSCCKECEESISKKLKLT
jgi:UPF0176 protein